MSPWEVLGLGREEAADPAAVKRAYARLLKVHRPDRDPEGFRRIRDAYEALTGGAEAGPASVPEPATAPAAPAPLELLRQGRWDEILALAARRRDAAARPDAGTDLDLARCLALVDPPAAGELAQHAFQADRQAVDPWMEHLLDAGRELAVFDAADRRLAAAAVLELLPEAEDPATARRLRVMGYQVSHAGLRTTLSAVAARLDRAPERVAKAALDHERARRDAAEARTAKLRWILAAAAIAIITLVALLPSSPRPPPPPLPTAQPAAPAPPPEPEPEPLDATARPAPDALSNYAVQLARKALARGDIASAAALFRRSSPTAGAAASARREEALRTALERLLADPAIPEDQRLDLARMVYRRGAPALRQVAFEAMPAAAQGD